MARPRKQAQEIQHPDDKDAKTVDSEPEKQPKAEESSFGLPKKALFRIDETARYFSVSERCIYLWIEHGHLKSEKINGITRISRESIIACRFRNAETCQAI